LISCTISCVLNHSQVHAIECAAALVHTRSMVYHRNRELQARQQAKLLQQQAGLQAAMGSNLGGSAQQLPTVAAPERVLAEKVGQQDNEACGTKPGSVAIKHTYEATKLPSQPQVC